MMDELRLVGLTAGVLSATAILSVVATSEAFARTETASPPAKTQTLFACRTDRLFKPLPSTDKTSDQGHAFGGRRAVNGDVRLAVATDTRTIRLFIRTAGEARREYVLKDVEQGSSLGSGAGGRADTVIRGRSGSSVFTLFAEYENNGADHEAALQIDGRSPVLLVCDGDQYLAPQVKGFGRFGTNNIYVLRGDELANGLQDLPDWPEFDR